MKFFALATLALLFSTSQSFAATEPVLELVKSPVFASFMTEQEKLGYELVSLTDSYREQGLSPNCPCSEVRIVLKSIADGSAKTCKAAMHLNHVALDESRCETENPVTQKILERCDFFHAPRQACIDIYATAIRHQTLGMNVDLALPHFNIQILEDIRNALAQQDSLGLNIEKDLLK